MPLAPLLTNVSQTDNTNVDIHFNSVADAANYQLVRNTNESGSWVTTVRDNILVVSNGLGGLVYYDTVTPLTEYYYKIRAKDSGGAVSADSNEGYLWAHGYGHNAVRAAISAGGLPMWIGERRAIQFSLISVAAWNRFYYIKPEWTITGAAYDTSANEPQIADTLSLNQRFLTINATTAGVITVNARVKKSGGVNEYYDAPFKTIRVLDPDAAPNLIVRVGTQRSIAAKATKVINEDAIADNGVINVWVGETLAVNVTDSTGHWRSMIDWGFDGDTHRNKPIASHAYLQTGTFTLTVSITNRPGATVSKTYTVNVTNRIADTTYDEANWAAAEARYNSLATNGSLNGKNIDITVPSGGEHINGIYFALRATGAHILFRVRNGSFPAITQRVDNTAAYFYTLRAGPGNAGHVIENGVRNVWMQGFKFAGNADGNTFSGIQVGHNETYPQFAVGDPTARDFPVGLAFIHCAGRLEGLEKMRAMISTWASYSSFIGCDITQVNDPGNDSNAIIVPGGYGRTVFIRSRFNGAGENMIVGGGNAALEDVVPTGNTLRKCFLFMPDLWRTDRAQQRSIKNLFELKIGLYTTLADCHIDNKFYSPSGGSQYQAILIKSASQGETYWAESGETTFQDCLMTRLDGGFGTSWDGFDCLKSTHLRLDGVLIRDPIDPNLYSVQEEGWVNPRPALLVNNGFDYVHFNNVIGHSTQALIKYSSETYDSCRGLEIKNSLLGLAGGFSSFSGSYQNYTAVRDYFSPTGFDITSNTFIDTENISNPSWLPPTPANTILNETWENQFSDFAARTLKTGIYKTIQDQITARTLGVESGVYSDVVLITPAAPTYVSHSDTTNDFVFAPPSGYVATDCEYSINNGGYQNCTTTTINVGNVNISAGNLIVRVKALANVRYSGLPLTNTSAQVFTTSGGGDTTAPTISITAPTAGTTISGAAVNLTCTATDNVGVTSVQWKIDGVNSGAAITVAPFGKTLDTTALSNGTHSITAVATDTSGNQTTSAARSVTVSNDASGKIVYTWLDGLVTP